MWILLRLVIAIVAFAVRQLSRPGKPNKDGIEGGRARYQRVHRHKGAITGFSLGVGLEAPLAFTLSRETARDRFFKKLGVATEIATGDDDFDSLVYVMCDHPMLGALLERSKDARAAIVSLLRDGFQTLRFDGHVLWADKRAPREPGDDEERLVGVLGEALAPLERDKSGRFSDRFVWRALVVEGVGWSFGGYAIGALVGFWGQPEDIHLDQRALFAWGMAFAALLFVALIALTIALMRGSSRGHRIILESALVLLIALPPSGWQGVADINRSVDMSRTSIEVPLSQCETRIKTTRRRGTTRTTRSYHLHLASRSVDGIALPDTLKTNAAVCAAVSPGTTATFVVGRGALGLAWIRQLRVPGHSWSS